MITSFAVFFITFNVTYHINIKKIGLNISFIRKSKNIKQVELAYMCGIEKQNLCRIETGRTNPTIKTLFIIAENLEVSITDIINI